MLLIKQVIRSKKEEKYDALLKVFSQHSVDGNFMCQLLQGLNHTTTSAL